MSTTCPPLFITPPTNSILRQGANNCDIKNVVKIPTFLVLFFCFTDDPKKNEVISPEENPAITLVPTNKHFFFNEENSELVSTCPT